MVLAGWHDGGTVTGTGPMPWFYFHLRSPERLERDDLGLEFPGIEAAYLEAFRTIPGMRAELAFRKLDPTPYTFEITDAGGRLLMEVPFTEVLDRGRQPVAPSSAERFRKGWAEMEQLGSRSAADRLSDADGVAAEVARSRSRDHRVEAGEP